MNGYVLHGPRDVRLESRSAPEVTPDDVLVKVSRAGICGSDIHYYTQGHAGAFVPKAPFVLGHEFSGVVVKTGAAVKNFRDGDRITVEPSIACGTCRYCRAGRYNLCSNMKFLGSASSYPHLDGGFAEYVMAPERNCFHLPDTIDDTVGALIEPLAVGTHAVMRAGSVAGKTLLITGAGTIGQSIMTVARALGATRIAVSDVDEYCLEFSSKHGADLAINPTRENFGPRAAEFAPFGFDVVFEASGSPAALSQALELVGRGGTLVQIGTQPSEVTLPANLTMSKEIQIVGSFRYAHAFPIVLDLLNSGSISVAHLVTHTFAFDKLVEGLETAVAGKNVIKVQVEIG